MIDPSGLARKGTTFLKWHRRSKGMFVASSEDARTQADVTDVGKGLYGWVAVGPLGKESGRTRPADAMTAADKWAEALTTGKTAPDSSGEWFHLAYGHSLPTPYAVDIRHNATLGEDITFLTSCEGCRGYGGRVHFLDTLPPGLWIEARVD